MFTVTVNEVKAPVPYTIDDDWAKELGFENLAELKDTFEKRFADEYQNLSRARLKRALLDRLAADYAFPVPRGHGRPRVRGDLEAAPGRDGAHAAARIEEQGKSEDELKAEYRAIAERRVRLGLILSDIGTKNEVKVEGEELQQAVMREAMRYPGQERKVVRVLQEQPGGARAAPGTPVRGQGLRLHLRARRT